MNKGMSGRNWESLDQQAIWWSVYHGDRFCSMLLGLPPGVNDTHYGLAMENIAGEQAFLQHKFTLQSATVAGKLIDRNVASGTPSFANAVTLDEHMEKIASSMPIAWWDLPDRLPDPGPELDEIRNRMLQQFYFFHVRTYLYFPFIIKQPKSSTSNHSNAACTEASRQMLRRYGVLRAKSHGVCLFECKTSDFVGFIAAVILFLCLSFSKETSGSQMLDGDLQLIEATRNFFRNVEREEGCKIAKQCYRALTALLGVHENTAGMTDMFPYSDKIVIPYFGVVVRKHLKEPLQSTSFTSINSSSNEAMPPSSVAATIGDMIPDPHYTTNAWSLDHGSDPVNSSILDDLQWEFDDFTDFTNFNTSHFNQLVDDTLIDIDGDWNLFLEPNEGYSGTR
jgi:hypothetical protein